MLDIKFQLPALERLAKIIGDAYTGTEITDLFRKADFGTVGHSGGTKWRFLYDAFERLQRDFGAESILKILKVVCNPQEMLNRANVRKEINECLSFYGLNIGEDGEIRRVEKARTPSDGDRLLFSQRNYHELVIEHSRAKFLEGDYFGAVRDCCVEFERFVRKKSGLEESGRRLMARALDANSGLRVALPHVSETTRNDVQEGIMHMCMGIMASARNPTAHESSRSFPIGHDEAMDILGVISHLCRQIDKMGSRAQG